ncbi:MAG: ABC transporter substrate-binding protein [Coxiellaceae bacterium]|nr:ABC transporter substrate-binding protein [Coxiellaceae bacterium]
MRVKRLVSFVIAAVFSTAVFAAQDQAPLAMMKSVSDEMRSTLVKYQGRIKNDMPFLQKTVRQQLVPHFDVDTMARSVVGRSHWSNATENERQRFMKEFTDMVVGVYSAPLAEFNGDTIKFYPIRENIGEKKRISIRSIIVRSTGQRIPVSYRLVRQNNEWKVYDFSIEGISMIQSYRSQFKDVLREKGFTGLLQQIEQHNRRA